MRVCLMSDWHPCVGHLCEVTAAGRGKERREKRTRGMGRSAGCRAEDGDQEERRGRGGDERELGKVKTVEQDS